MTFYHAFAIKLFLFAGLPRRKNLHATVNNISPVKQIVKHHQNARE